MTVNPQAYLKTRLQFSTYTQKDHRIVRAFYLPTREIFELKMGLGEKRSDVEQALRDIVHEHLQSESVLAGADFSKVTIG